MRGKAVALASCVGIILLLAAADTQGQIARVRSATLLAAGDIGSCTAAAAATGALVARHRGTVATLGDNAYPNGTPDDFARCYDPVWGRVLSRTRPAAGNHDYLTPGAAGYFGYFGRRAGNPPRGYYTYRLRAWRAIVLNSNCDAVGGCGNGSPQEEWLRAILRAHRVRCTLAYWHHPRFSTGSHGDDVSSDAFWRDLYAAGADVVLTAHDHDYERFAPIGATGVVDQRYGVREFVVGTGGGELHPFFSDDPALRARENTVFGVLRLVLRPRGYSWRFLPAAGGTFHDGGTARCHAPPP